MPPTSAHRCAHHPPKGHSKESPTCLFDTRAGPWKAEMTDVNRRPTAITYKALIGLMWTPTALGLVPMPGSLANSPRLYAQVCAVAVVVGCLISLVGLLWLRSRLTGLTIEQVGLVLIAFGCTMYFVALLSVPNASAALPAMGLTAAFAVGAAVQFFLISRFRRQRAVAQEPQA